MDNLPNIYQNKHELWLKVLFSSFAIKNDDISRMIYEFATMEFRHLKWISNSLKENNLEYSYSKGAIDIEKKTNFEFFEFLISEIKLCIKSYDPQKELFARILSDEYYMISVLESYLTDDKNNADITAFNRSRNYDGKNLDCQSRDALTLFLFEESYKEYELILLYSYFQNYTDNILQYNVYQDMVDESQFHLKSFGTMLAKMGILAIPRTVIPELYKDKDVKEFLIGGIDEEINAKQECKDLADAIDDEEISKFLEFIMYQEDYHIYLMKKVLNEFK